MSHKFDKNRSVSVAYCKIPLYYTQIFYANDKTKQLVLMDRIGKNYTACWRNNELNKVGIEFLLKAVDIRCLVEGHQSHSLMDKIFFAQLVLLTIGQIIIINSNKKKPTR